MSGSGEIIGITGGIGSGKSVVSRILRLNGLLVYDCDMEARILMENDGEIRKDLITLLGEETYDSLGLLNRPFVSSRIFSDNSLRDGVNAIVHAAVRKHFMRFRLESDSTVFCESAILATSGLDLFCNRIWLVNAPEIIRIERVKQRNGLKEPEIIRRIKSQEKEIELLPSEKIDIIDNSGDVSILERITALLPKSFNLIKTVSYERMVAV